MVFLRDIDDELILQTLGEAGRTLRLRKNGQKKSAGLAGALYPYRNYQEACLLISIKRVRMVSLAAGPGANM